jgi:hypothetical protein
VTASRRRSWHWWRSIARPGPDFLIIGGQKCGTTSLYQYLTQHPRVAPAVRKEIQYFSEHYHRGPRWYRRHFPPLVARNPGRLIGRKRLLTGEATPYYLFHPRAPRRVRDSLPHVKLIAMLRNPVDRAYSHYRYHSKLGDETLSFEEVLEAEPSRLEPELQRMLRDESYESIEYRNYSYLARGIYIEQLERWFSLFPREQMLILSSEEFFRAPASSYQETLRFLGLPEHELDRYEAVNVGSYSSLSAATRSRLEEYYRDHNRRLYEYLDRDFGWG